MKQNTIRSKWLVLVSVCVGTLMSGISASMINIAFPRLAAIFNADASIVLWVTVAYLLVITGLMAIVGKIGDIVGRKKLYLIGLGIFILALALCSISQSVIQLIIFRAIQGVGGAILTALSYAIVTATFGDNERGKALGILTSVGLAGPLIGPVVSGIFLEALDWRSLFYLVIPLGVIALVMCWFYLTEQKVSQASRKIDYWGAGLLFSALSFLVLFLNMGGRLGFDSLMVIAFILVSVVLFTLFFIREKRINFPVVELSLFKNRVFAFSNITALLLSLSISGYIFLMPFFLIDGLGYSAWKTGLVYVMAPLATTLLSPFAGWLSDKVSPRLLCTIGIAVFSCGIFMFSRFTAEATLLTMIPGLIVFGIGMALFNAPNINRIMGSVKTNELGLASSLMNTMTQIGMSGGIAVLGLIFTTREATNYAQLISQNLQPAAAQQLSAIGGFQNSLLVASIIGALGIFTSVLAPGSFRKPITKR